MTEYNVTIGYKSVITVRVKADDEETAKDLALQKFNKERDKWFQRRDIILDDDSYGVKGILDMDETWNSLY